MASKLDKIMNWLIKSRMKVNETQTEKSQFDKGDTTPIEPTLNGTIREILYKGKDQIA